MIIQDLFQKKDKQNTISRSGLRRHHDNSDMCTWLSKASDIQAPLTESQNRHHSTVSAAGGARSESGVVTTAHRMGVRCGHMQRVNTIQSASSAGCGQGHPQGDTRTQKAVCVKLQPCKQISGRAALINPVKGSRKGLGPRFTSADEKLAAHKRQCKHCSR